MKPDTRHGHIVCAICDQPISPADYPSSYCWPDPGGNVLAAHGACLIRLGETDLGLERIEETTA